ncbi:MAG: hypothetical protein ABIQ95_01830 [Bdellovibrionia bacterium]
MKKENLVLLALTLFTTIATGCGRNYIGTYSGTETIALSTVYSGNTSATAPVAPTIAQLTLTITSSSGNHLMGTWSSQGQQGNFQGTAGGDSISDVTLTMVGAPTSINMQGAYGQMAYNPALQMGLCSIFKGNLSFTPSNQILGTLNVFSPIQPQIQTQAQTQTTTTQQNYGNVPSCAGNRNINLSKLN